MTTSSRKPRRRARTDETEDSPKKPARDYRRMRAILRILGADPDVNATYKQLCAQYEINPDGDDE